MVEANVDMSRIYALSPLRKVLYLRNLRVDHPHLQVVGESLVEFLHPYNDISIIFIAGVSGVGKTALVEELAPQLLEFVDYEHPGGIFFVEAPSNNNRKMEISAVYDKVIRRLDSLADKKIVIEEDENRIKRGLQLDRQKVEWRKEEMLRLLRARKVLALAIDEVFHLIRYGDPYSLLDTLKTLASDFCPKLIAIGGGQMLDAVDGYAQVDLRSTTLYLPRYGAVSGLPDDVNDHEAYHRSEINGMKVILQKLENLWPYDDVPDLCSRADFFYKDCLGDMRMIKRECERYAQAQGRNGGKWEIDFFEACEVPVDRTARAKEEFEQLEEKIRGSDDGCMALKPKILASRDPDAASRNSKRAKARKT